MTQLILLNDTSVLGKSKALPINGHGGMRSIQTSVYGTGAVAASVRIYGANDLRYPVEICTVPLSGNGQFTDVVKDSLPFTYYIAELLSISGTAARVSVVASV